jgi:phenylpropionate dioxygenase-like ring-hydroxylating dioxygenase large terminal subunit
VTLTYNRDYLLNLVDPKKGLIDRRIYSDPDIYQLELEQIFARAWNFMCHDSQIPNPGDFFMSYIGEDRVICVRDNDGNPQLLINSCRHRGNAVCRAEEGHATSFMCTYHGWTYDLKGALVGVPGFKEVYHEELDRENLGLIRGRAESYRGWIFATLDPEAPSLYDYLGEVGRMGIDQVCARGHTTQVMGIQKWIIPCNWKFAVDNCWDFYHLVTHASSFMGGWRLGPIVKPGEKEEQPSMADTPGHIAVLGEYGHAIGGWAVEKETVDRMSTRKTDKSWWDKPDTQAILGDVGKRSASAHPNIFPNLWLFNFLAKASLRLPKGPTTTEIWWFIFGNPDATKDEWEYHRQRIIRHDGPGGVFEQDDGENWEQSTRGTTGVVTRRYPIHMAQNIGHGLVSNENGPPHIDTGGNEHAQLWYYEQWSKWLTAGSWPELAAMQQKPEGYR